MFGFKKGNTAPPKIFPFLCRKKTMEELTAPTWNEKTLSKIQKEQNQQAEKRFYLRIINYEK